MLPWLQIRREAEEEERKKREEEEEKARIEVKRTRVQFDNVNCIIHQKNYFFADTCIHKSSVLQILELCLHFII